MKDGKVIRIFSPPSFDEVNSNQKSGLEIPYSIEGTEIDRENKANTEWTNSSTKFDGRKLFSKEIIFHQKVKTSSERNDDCNDILDKYILRKNLIKLIENVYEGEKNDNDERAKFKKQLRIPSKSKIKKSQKNKSVDSIKGQGNLSDIFSISTTSTKSHLYKDQDHRNIQKERSQNHTLEGYYCNLVLNYLSEKFKFAETEEKIVEENNDKYSRFTEEKSLNSESAKKTDLAEEGYMREMVKNSTTRSNNNKCIDERKKNRKDSSFKKAIVGRAIEKMEETFLSKEELHDMNYEICNVIRNPLHYQLEKK